MTLAEFVGLPDSDHMELIDGVPQEKEMAIRERFVQGNVVTELNTAQRDRRVGLALVEGLIRIDPENPERGRRPDVAFITLERLGDRDIEDPWLDVCPDLCVEVVSPNDTSFEVAGKVAEYLAAGAKLVWEVQPEIRAVIVHRADGTARHVRGAEHLTGEDVLPGFDVPASRLFPPA